MKIGIALASYQPRIDFFAEQLKSLQDQTHSDWICVITLDPGLDATHPGARLTALSEALELKPFFSDARFIWSENESRLGHKKNFERAIQSALAQPNVEAIACSDQDDVWYPEKLARSAQTLAEAGPLSLVHTDMHSLGRDGKISHSTVWAIEQRGIHHSQASHLLIRNLVAGCSMLFDAELARRFPRIPDGALYHDHWYALAASFYGGIHPIHEPLYAYRQHGGNEVGVTPFIGTFTLPKGLVKRQIFAKCKTGWFKSKAFAVSARDEGLPLKSWHRLVFIAPWDFGAGIFLLALSALGSDRPLARACFAKAAGKFLAVFSRK